MRTLSAFLFQSLDGVVDAPHAFVRGDLYEEFPALIGDVIAGQDTVLLGRQTYEEWSAFWPRATIEPFASFINATPKYVASGTLAHLDWPQSYRLAGTLEDGVRALKAQPGKTIGVHGSIRVVQSLLRAGLLDELRVLLVPALAGAGRRLLDGDGAPIQLQLHASHTTPKGLHVLVYRPDGGHPVVASS